MPGNLRAFRRNLMFRAGFCVFVFFSGIVVRSSAAQQESVSGSSDVTPQTGQSLACSQSSKVRAQISCLQRVAARYQSQGDYGSAEPLLKRMLALREATEPADSPDVSRAVSALALAYVAQNKWADAEPLYDRLVAISSHGPKANCGGEHLWGDELHCYITFQGKAKFTHVEISFNLPDSQYAQKNPEQPGQFINFVLRDSRKVGRKTYEVSGVVSHSVPGIYVLSGATASIGDSYQDYLNGYNFKSSLVVRVRAPKMEKAVAPKNIIRLPGAIGLSPDSITINPSSFVRPVEPKILEIGPGNQADSRDRRDNSKKCGGNHKPGDTLTCYVTFDRPTKFASVKLAFSAPPGPVTTSGLCKGPMLENSERIDSQTFRVTGIVPPCGSSTYALIAVLTETPDRQYRNGADFVSSVSFYLENHHQTIFPNLANVGSNPHVF